jgi:murein DD-endopeptidase MepM/ murein hydrolase activator NlpD
MGPSSAGAVGWMQFMPSTWYRWGTDADGDGIADPWNPTDGIYSAARYLAAAGGASDIYRAVFAYNHADWYVQEVLDLAKLYGGDATVAFTLDRLQANLDEARSTAADAGERLHTAELVAHLNARVAARWQAKADAARLLSDRLVFEQKAGLALQRQAAAQAKVDELSRALADAQAALQRAQRASAASSFAPGASQLLAAPSYSGGYVFPVGGGPQNVSASHTHHDYPAVDIAAPMGSPLYALANGVVVRAWPTPDGRCGIGLTMRAEDGLAWTYCHMSVLDPAIRSGSVVSAGTPVGRVGETGHATGPHLHLQLQPPTQWPQQMAWFQAFAGSAFTWSDVPTTSEPAAAPRAVFSIVPTARSQVVTFTR